MPSPCMWTCQSRRCRHFSEKATNDFETHEVHGGFVAITTLNVLLQCTHYVNRRTSCQNWYAVNTKVWISETSNKVTRHEFSKDFWTFNLTYCIVKPALVEHGNNALCHMRKVPPVSCSTSSVRGGYATYRQSSLIHPWSTTQQRQ